MLTIDLESTAPLEEQVRRGLRHAIARGEVRPGECLPSVRQLAGDLGIHWNTVARAYRRLRDEGLVVGGRGRRVVVRGLGGAARSGAGRHGIRARLREVLTEARLAGLSLPEVERLLATEVKRWQKEEQR
jgi:DNA-binding transcriptional regulator YhcF (GntR family)